MIVDTFASLLHLRVEEDPERLAYRFVGDSEGEQSLTYGELYRRAASIAHVLSGSNLANIPVLTVYPAGIECICGFMGCLLAGVIAVPAPPPASRRSLRRLQAIVEDVKPALILSTLNLGEKLARLFEGVPTLRNIRRIATDHLPNYFVRSFEVVPDQIAFLQYTSGSTGAPRGVIVTHRNLMDNSAAIKDAFRYGPDSHCFSWLPPYHDMGLIGGILQPLHGGFPCTLMSAASFLQTPFRWLEGVSRYHATISGAPNFAYDLCSSRVAPYQVETLDLRDWSVAFNSAEPVRCHTIERFATTFAPAGFSLRAFRPCYGLAEATLLVSASRPDQVPTIRGFDRASLGRNKIVPLPETVLEPVARRLVGVGEAQSSVLVVDPDTGQVTDGIGEIWVPTWMCSQGYWNRPETTAETFNAKVDTHPGTYLRTGDLGCIFKGELFITGRLKDLIIIRGINHNPHDIELTLEQTDARLRPNCGAVFGIDVDSEERVVVVQELDRHGDVDLPALVDRVRRRISLEHDLTPHAILFVARGVIPKTSSGKIQRALCRDMYLAGQLPAEAPWTDTPPLRSRSPSTGVSASEMLIDLFASHSGLSAAEIDLRMRVAALGLDSLRATELLHAVERKTGSTVQLSRFMENPTVQELLTEIIWSTNSGRTDNDAGHSGEYPLTVGQRSLLSLRELSCTNGGPDINIAIGLRVHGTSFDLRKFQRVWDSLVARHPMLRTIFPDAGEGAIVQRVLDHVSIPFAAHDASNWEDEKLNNRLANAAYARFDLRHECPIRVAVFRRADDLHVVVIAINHIAADFWSLSLLFDEMRQTYSAELAGRSASLQPVRGRFSEHVRHEQQLLTEADINRLADRWMERFKNLPPPLQFYTDGLRPSVRSFWGASRLLTISRETTTRLRHLAYQHETTLYTVVLAAFQAWLARYTGQLDFAVTSATAARREDCADVVGYFANPLVMRSDVSGNPSFDELVGRARREVLVALAIQAYPFPLLLERLRLETDLSRPPLAQAMFVLYSQRRRSDRDVTSFAVGNGATTELADLVVESMPLPVCVTQYDISLIMADCNTDLVGTLEYNKGLFDGDTIESATESFVHALESLSLDSQRPLSRFDLMSSERRDLVVNGWNNTAKTLSHGRNLHELFEDQVDRTPLAQAISFLGNSLTYRELNNRANALAWKLRARGVGLESLIGVFAERSIEIVVAILAVLKAGAAYVPLDPEAPPERTRGYVAGAGLVYVLTDEDQPATLTEHFPSILSIASPNEGLSHFVPNPSSGCNGNNLAYVIYTSGSTGQPKGVMNTHAAICNRLLWMQHVYHLESGDRTLQKTPFTFDVSVWEIFLPLITGSVLVLAPPRVHRDPAALVQLIRDERITTIHFVPSLLRAFLGQTQVHSCESLRRVFCSGELLPTDLQREYFAKLGVELHNLYGPTEAAVDVTAWMCEENSALTRVPIGKPIANTQVYILDPSLEPVSPGMVGMLYLGGTGLARGYLRRPDLTAEKFVPNPFSRTPGARLFRTGDLGRFRHDGVIEYVGRTDYQIKIRGVRVETSEVEVILNRHPLVGESVVVNRPESGQPRLIAYVVPKSQENLLSSTLRRWLSSFLPQPCIPAAFVLLDRLPLTSSGKPDRAALPEPPDERPSMDTPFIAPRTPEERDMATLWAKVLGLSEVGVDDNFFELGGNSLSVTQVIAHVREGFGVEIPFNLFLEAPTVAGAVVAITSLQLEGESTDRAAQLLAEVKRH